MDNRYFKNGCPPLMQDGRFVTSYLESRVFEQFVRNVNNIGSAQEYKRFLQIHGDSIINRERAYQESINTCSVHGKCVPLSGLPGSNSASCGCACNK